MYFVVAPACLLVCSVLLFLCCRRRLMHDGIHQFVGCMGREWETVRSLAAEHGCPRVCVVVVVFLLCVVGCLSFVLCCSALRNDSEASAERNVCGLFLSFFSVWKKKILIFFSCFV